jgi:uncharacterized protein YjbI with pentapeptide repeats
MANDEHLWNLKRGVDKWNKWRKDNPEILPNLQGADLIKADLSGANLEEANLQGAFLSGARLIAADLSGAELDGANLSRADISGAKLIGAYLRQARLQGTFLSKAELNVADLSKANLRGADLSGAYLEESNLFRTKLIGANLRGARLRFAYLRWASLNGADLREADLSGAYLSEADLNGADLRGADLSEASLVHTILQNTKLTGCFVYGIAAWDLLLLGSDQTNLVITPKDQPSITVDNLEIAQFIYLLLNNVKIRDVIDTLTSKTVLILGRFTKERKAILDALRETLRQRNYLPILFDFDKPASRDLTETISTLAHMSRFIIADITEPKSIPQELYAIVPNLAIPVQPLLLQGSSGEYSMFQDLRKFSWVLTTYEYSSLDSLLSSLEEMVISPAEAKAEELRNR